MNIIDRMDFMRSNFGDMILQDKICQREQPKIYKLKFTSVKIGSG